ncbi:MAG: hypothetical protein V7637_2396 [Mycobacteriales bacterium]|jgi:hypothetical protein
MVDPNLSESPDAVHSERADAGRRAPARPARDVPHRSSRAAGASRAADGQLPRWVLVELPGEDDPAAEFDAAPRYELVAKSHWPNTLTWIVVGAFLVSIITAVFVIAFDATARVAVVSALTVTVTSALVRLALRWLPHQPRTGRRYPGKD